MMIMRFFEVPLLWYQSDHNFSRDDMEFGLVTRCMLKLEMKIFEEISGLLANSVLKACASILAFY